MLPHYNTINEFLEAAGFAGRTTNPYFYMVRLEDTYPHVRAVMPPFRKDFYLVALVYNPGARSIFQIDGAGRSQLPYYLVFQSPGHVLAWQRQPGLAGYLIYFKAECFTFMRSVLADEFPFFDLLHTNFFQISANLFTDLSVDFDGLLQEQEGKHLFSEQVLYARLLAVLYRCRAAYQTFQESQLNQSAATLLTTRFVGLVQANYLQKRTVEAYASLLAVTPNHLNDSVRKATGHNAYWFITSKLAQEAQSLIRFTTADISEIAYQLNFSGPAHFAKFFKKHTGQTPGDFRREAESVK
ncbi:helix-turn-helix transcriptional regulator [Fibrella sp. HMF5335]|uniref:Helix-turn-helix transcriptional regulator n=1 Tax=Fibrella rubiginis TaxID=2817060 RepID=A0A939GKG0_9BACT|nr:AraC family transcriptional regulator [Fibrella rubiginis]MBO0939065.1 helix-turn-helix transcriptional regulator [Fibrella rubiginis]